MAHKVIVLGGGNSPERDVSWRSATAIKNAASQAGFETELIDTKDGYDFLDTMVPTSVVLPILHGIGGEDGEIQTELENRQLKFLGSGSQASKVAFDKWLTKQHLTQVGIQHPYGVLVNADQYIDHPLTKQPHVLKACRNGSSIGTYVVKDPNAIDQDQVKNVFSFAPQALLEELVEGTEITVGVLGNQALPVIEIIPPQGKEFDFENKYNGSTQELCPPQNVSAELQQQAQNLALKTHQALNCLHLSRTDIIITPQGDLIVLEINTMPGMTDQSLYPRSAKVAGLTLQQLVEKFVGMALKEGR